MRTLVTIGYERRDVDELVELLSDAGVEVVVDVRQNAASRKRGFSKRQLASALDAAGIAYRHETTLGNPKANREALGAGDPEARRFYLERLRTEGRDALDTVAELVGESTVALLCYEREHQICHRSCVAETLVDEVDRLELEHL